MEVWKRAALQPSLSVCVSACLPVSWNYCCRSLLGRVHAVCRRSSGGKWPFRRFAAHGTKEIPPHLHLPRSANLCVRDLATGNSPSLLLCWSGLVTACKARVGSHLGRTVAKCWAAAKPRLPAAPSWNQGDRRQGHALLEQSLPGLESGVVRAGGRWKDAQGGGSGGRRDYVS